MLSSKLCLCDIDSQRSQKEPKVCLAQSLNTQEVWYYFLEYPDVSFERITQKESLQEWRASTQKTCTHWVFYNRFPSFRTSEVKTGKQMSSPPLPLITQIKEGHYLYPPFHEHPQSSRARVVGKPACSGLFFSPGHGISPGSLFCPCTPMGIRVNNGFRSAKCEGTDVAKAYDGGKHQARCFLLV